MKGTGGAIAPNHASRLIVRNLPFNATEQDLRAVFLPYGPIYSVHIPTADKQETAGEETAKRVRTKGFAFVWMLSRKDAEKAIEGCNGMVVRAGTAESMVSDKQKKKKQRREEKKQKAAAAGGGGGEDGDEEAEVEEVIDDKRATERVIAVDWALSKEKWKEEKAKIEEGGEDVEMKDGSGSDGSEKDEHSDGESDESDDEGGLGVHEGGESDDEDDSDDNQDDDTEEPTKPTLPPPETGTTLFIRNVPFTATEDDLRTLYVIFLTTEKHPTDTDFKLPCFRAPAIRSNYPRPRYWPVARHRLCLFLESGRCG